MIAFVIYVLALIALGLHLPEVFFDPTARQFILLLGILSIWRYGWGAVHHIRAWRYRRLVFPRWRKAANTFAAQNPDEDQHIFFLITTFRIGTETSVRVYREAIKEAIRCGKPATLIASVVEMSDEKLVKSLFHALQPPARIKLCFNRIAGTGKRDALATGFVTISRLHPGENDLAVVIDGDSILTPGCINQCAPLFATRPRMGALTTDEISELEDGGTVTELYRRWYSMRFAQRHILMSSMGLAGRVLTLTGRMSIFRASIAIQPEFIATVQEDHIDHWRLGRFKFLTGDDKSSWYHLLKNGWEMAYVPDVKIITVEEPPHQNFFVGATMLMVRWFGNMLRTNSRALSVPRRKIGFFVWWCLIDQRISMWTSLFGLTAAMFGIAMFGTDMLLFFLFWIGATRLILALLLLSARPRISITYPFLLYFSQIYGSLVKIYMLTHLNRQKWTRQKTTLSSQTSPWQRHSEPLFSNLAMSTALLTFICSVGFMTGFFTYNDLYNFVILLT